MASLDTSLLTSLVMTLVVILALSLLLRRFKQPAFVVFLLAGIVIGPFGLSFVGETGFVELVGTFGLLFMLFFVGMELDLSVLKKHAKVGVIGVFVQIVLSLILSYIIGSFLDWPVGRVLLIAFVLTLSSTAVVLRLLQGKLDTRLGRNVLMILLMQDIAVIPMLLTLTLIEGPIDYLPFIGIAIFIIVSFFAFRFSLPKRLVKAIKDDEEYHVFAALFLCSIFALLASQFHLSAVLGAFLAGMLAKKWDLCWATETLEPFRDLFLAIFFLSIGMILDLSFVLANWYLITGLAILAIAINLVINYIMLRIMNKNHSDALHGAAILSQLSEFGYVLASTALAIGVIAPFGYQMTIAIITLTLIIAPFVVTLTRKASSLF